MMEQWKPIESHPEYEVSDLGRVRHGDHIMKLTPNDKGYLRVGLSLAGKVTTLYVHRIVCAAFNGPPLPSQTDCRHDNGRRGDNWPANLFWATHAENEQDKRRHGTLIYGEASANAKLSNEAVLSMRDAVAGGAQIKEVARQHGVDARLAASAVTGRRWGNLPNATGPTRRVCIFTDDDIRLIRARAATGSLMKDLAAEFGVRDAAICKIVKRQRWAHVV